MNKTRRTSQETAKELMERLARDPEWVRARAEEEARRREIADRNRREMLPDELPLLEELATVGIKVKSLSELINAKWPYPAAIPVLCAHLQSANNAFVREGIARALTVKEARPMAGPIVLAELERQSSTSPSSVRWALANALTVIADKNMTPKIEALISDPEYTDVHNILGLAIKRLKKLRK